jgi:hypothetical protein
MKQDSTTNNVELYWYRSKDGQLSVVLSYYVDFLFVAVEKEEE